MRITKENMLEVPGKPINNVEVFKTDVQYIHQSHTLVEKLLLAFPGHQINFDLEDCDKILRIEGSAICIERITEILRSNGHQCEILP